MANWARFCKAKQFTVDEPHVHVHFPNGRKQRVRVFEQDDVLRLVSTVLGKAAVESLTGQGGADAFDRLALRIMQRNRSVPLVKFWLTPGGRLTAESSVPRVGLARDEFRLVLQSIAWEADRLEHLLTGEDRN
jgi:hypothetical protein